MSKTSVSFNGTKSCSSPLSNPLLLKELNHSVAPVNTAFFAALAIIYKSWSILKTYFRKFCEAKQMMSCIVKNHLFL